MTRAICLAVGCFATIICCACYCIAQDQDELAEELQPVNSLIAGTRTPLALVQEKCDALLQDHTAPEEQGRIYYVLTESYGQARMSVNGNAAKVIEYAQKALKCPLDPSRRLRLYMYWGDAIVLNDVTRRIPETRAAAAVVYLRGLKEAKEYNIPDVAPARQNGFFPVKGMDEDTFKRQRAAHAVEVQRVLKIQEICRRRDALLQQLLYDYSRKPRAPEELRKLATEVLGAGPDVEKLMAALATKCERVDKRLEL